MKTHVGVRNGLFTTTEMDLKSAGKKVNGWCIHIQRPQKSKAIFAFGDCELALAALSKLHGLQIRIMYYQEDVSSKY